MTVIETWGSAQRGQSLQLDDTTLTTMFGPKWRMLPIGANQLSQAVATLAIHVVQRENGMPDVVVRQLVHDAHTAVVAEIVQAKNLIHKPQL